MEACQFKYVQIKISKRKLIGEKKSERKDLLQIIDVSDKMLYGEVRAEQVFLTLINAAVSHELRNPLNSLIGQVTSMKDFFIGFEKVIAFLNQNLTAGDSIGELERDSKLAKGVDFLNELRQGIASSI